MVRGNGICFTEKHEWFCVLCNRVFTSEAAIFQHCQSAALHKDAWCQRCEWLFSSPAARTNHQQESSKHYLCIVCESDFNNKIEYSSHLENGLCQKCPVTGVSEAPYSPTAAASALAEAAQHNEGIRSAAEAIARAMLWEAASGTDFVWHGLSCDRCDMMLGSRVELFQVCILRECCVMGTKSIKAYRCPYSGCRDLLRLPFQLPRHF